MKKFFTLLCLAAVANFYGLHAQTNPPKLLAIADKGYGTTAGTRGTLYYGDSTLSYYAPSRTYNSKKGWLADTSVRWYNGSTVWAGYHLETRSLNHYDDSGNQTVALGQRYSYTDTSWHNENMDSMAYDAYNNLIYLDYRAWDATSSNWQYQQRDVYVYNATGQLLSTAIQSWDNTSGTWVNQSRYHAVYSGSDLLADSSLSWNSATGTWGNAGFSVAEHSVYDSYHRKVKDTSWQWSISNNAWLPRWVDDSFSYNSSDKLIYEGFQTFDTVSMSWTDPGFYKAAYDAAGNDISDTLWINNLPNQLRTFTYDAAGRQLSFRNSYWDIVGGKWQDSSEYDDTYDSHGKTLAYVYKLATHGKGLVNQMRSLYTYNSYSEMLSTEYDIWDTTAGSWFRQNFETYYYDSLLNVANINSPVQAQLSVYPVPAATTLTIDIKWPQPHTARLAIYDVNGRLYRQWQTDAAATYHNSIPVADLPVGNYILVAKQGDAATTARFSISR